MAVSITHPAVATGADDPTKEINKGEWNAEHAVAGLAVVAESGQYSDLLGIPASFTPAAHAASHTFGGSDVVAVQRAQMEALNTSTLMGRGSGIGAPQEIIVGTGLGISGITLFLSAHAASHQNGGSDEISVTGLSGLLADGQTALAHAASHQNGGADEISVVGLSGLLADAQTPLSHATSHQAGGSDAIKLDDLAATDDNTDLNASLSAHGLMQKYPGGTTNFLRADGSFAAPTAAAADPAYSPGSFTVVTETARAIFNHLKLTGSQRATLQGTARLRLSN